MPTEMRSTAKGPNHVRGMSKQMEQELLASFSTMGPPIFFNGYLAPAAAAKATSNAPPTPTPPPPLQTESFRKRVRAPSWDWGLAMRGSSLHNSHKYAKPLNSAVCWKNPGVLQFTVWLRMMENYWFMNGREASWERLMGWCLGVSSRRLRFPLTSGWGHLVRNAGEQPAGCLRETVQKGTDAKRWMCVAGRTERRHSTLKVLICFLNRSHKLDPLKKKEKQDTEKHGTRQ